MEKHKRPKIGWHHTKEARLKISRGHIGKVISAETRRKLSVASIKRGAVPPSRKGVKLTRKQKQHLSQILMGRGMKKNPTYRAMHNWIKKRKGTPSTCEHCKKTGLKGHKIHWANIDHKYERKLQKYIRLCAQCHTDYDNDRKISFKGMRLTQSQWARKLGLNKHTLESRLRRKWLLKDALIGKIAKV